MSFEEYYSHYLTLHRHPLNRRLHVLGQLVTVLTLLGAVLLKSWILLLVTPLVVYPFAWSGHYFFEKNSPAAFSRPLWAKACDWVMLKDIATGRIKW